MESAVVVGRTQDIQVEMQARVIVARSYATLLKERKQPTHLTDSDARHYLDKLAIHLDVLSQLISDPLGARVQQTSASQTFNTEDFPLLVRWADSQG